MEKTTILIIDQDETSRHFLEQILSKHDYAVVQAASGRDGWAKVNEILPALVACDTNLPDVKVIDFLQAMGRDKRLAAIPVVVLSGHADPDEMGKFIGAGAVDYYAKSGLSALNFVNSIPRILTETGKTRQAEANGLLVVFLSAKGGTGTSTLCANIGMNIAKNMTQSTVAIVDLVLPMGSIAPIVGYQGDFNIVQAADLPPQDATPDYFREKLIVSPNWAFHLLPGAPDPAMSNALKADRIPDIIKALRETFDYVLVDVGRALSRISLPLIEKANAVVLILSPDLSTVGLTQKALAYLQNQGVHTDRIFPILNRAVGLEGLSKAECEKILGLEIKMTMPYAMSNFTLANNQNTPIVVKFPTDTFSMVFKQAAIEISQTAIRAQVAAANAK